MNIYNVPVYFSVVAKTQETADNAIITFLNMSFKEFAVENKIDAYALIDNYDPLNSTEKSFCS